MKFALIMSSIPGSGKSTFAKYFASQGYHLRESLQDNIIYFYCTKTDKLISAIHSTDLYHYNDVGEYKWTSENCKIFHKKNYEAFKKSCKDGIEIVICDNTNLTKSEYEKYVQAARAYGYIIAVCKMDIPDVETSFRRNIHKVPRETIIQMRNKLLEQEDKTGLLKFKNKCIGYIKKYFNKLKIKFGLK